MPFPLNRIAPFVKSQRKILHLTQRDFAMRVGVGYNFIRELEQGKQTQRLDKINKVLHYLGYEAGPIKINKPHDQTS